MTSKGGLYAAAFEANSMGYVSPTENTADCATRGLPPTELKDFELWWTGPDRLRCNQNCWPVAEVGLCWVGDTDQEVKVDKRLIHQVTDRSPPLLKGFRHAVRLYIIRFTNNVGRKKGNCRGPLTIEELDHALKALLRIVHREAFSGNLAPFSGSKRLPSRSKLLSLTPILSDDILRVKGRLRHSPLSHEPRYPIILPNYH